MWYKFAAIRVKDQEIPEEDFFNKFVNVLQYFIYKFSYSKYIELIGT